MDKIFKEKLINNELEKGDEEVFKKYMDALDLKPEDFDKKILDVGSDRADFAKWAKDHGVSSEIYSLDPRGDFKEKEKSFRGVVEKMPFKDGNFDLVVSCAAIPNVFLWEKEDKIKESFLEMLRVIKPGGEIRLGKVLKWNDPHEKPQEITKSINSVLAELKNNNVGVEEIRQPFYDHYEYDKKHRPVRLLAEAYLIKLYKLE